MVEKITINGIEGVFYPKEEYIELRKTIQNLNEELNRMVELNG